MTEDQYDGIIKHLQDVRAGMELVFEEISNVSRRIGLILDPAGDTAAPAKKNGQVPLEPVAVALASPKPEAPNLADKRFKNFTGDEMRLYNNEYYRCVTRQKRLGLPRLPSPLLDRPPVDTVERSRIGSTASAKARAARIERDLDKARKIMERAIQGLVTPHQASKAAAILSKHRRKTEATALASK